MIQNNVDDNIIMDSTKIDEEKLKEIKNDMKF